MTQAEADQCVAFMGRLFPAMSRDVARLLAIAKAFLPLQAAEVRHAIESRVGVDQFPDIPAIVAWCTPPSARVDPKAGPVVRVNGLTPGELKAQREAGERLKADRRRAVEAVARLDEATRERLRKLAVERLPADVRPFFSERPATSPGLLDVVVELATAGGHLSTVDR